MPASTHYIIRASNKYGGQPSSTANFAETKIEVQILN